MRTITNIGSVAIAAVFVLALAIDTADARGGRGGGGGGMRGGGGAMRSGGFSGAGRAGMASGPRGPHVSQPIARPGPGNRPGGPNWANRPGYNPGWGYRPGYGWGAAAAVGAGLAYGSSYYGSGYGYYDEPYPAYSYEAGGSDGDAIAECARRFKTYDPASQTYIKRKGVRASCP
jgi:BA14K-like protein